MKIKGRLIATLAALGLLIAMLPIGPASAAVGTVGIKGGFDGKFFSDKTGFNVVTLSVTDQDLSPARIGYARFTSSLDSRGGRNRVRPEKRPSLIARGTGESMVLAGEKGKTDELDGARYANATYSDTTDPFGDPAVAAIAADMAARWRIYVALAAKEDPTDRRYCQHGQDVPLLGR